VVVAAALRKFLTHDWSWYFGLALAACDGLPIDLSELRCPVTVLAGRYDLVTDINHVRRRMASVPHARLRELPTSHFLPLEAPDEVLSELRRLVEGRSDPIAEQNGSHSLLTTGSRDGI
jgi:3-oxoadipate enol-lactonase